VFAVDAGGWAGVGDLADGGGGGVEQPLQEGAGTGDLVQVRRQRSDCRLSGSRFHDPDHQDDPARENLLYRFKAGQRAASGRPRPAAPMPLLRRSATVPALVLDCAIDVSMRGSTMDRDQFWSMIETARQASGGDVEQQAAALKAQLRRLPLAEVTDFQRILDDLQAESFSVQLWGAAEVIVDGVSEGHFYGFRGWLIAQGQGTYRAAAADPDSLADLPGPGLRAREGMLLPWGEAMWYVAVEVHQERTGGEPHPEMCGITELIGSWWPYDQHHEQLRRRYPRLWARFRSNTHR
jgi:hypothetical protein